MHAHLQQADKLIEGEKSKGEQEEKGKEEEAAGAGVMQVVQYHISIHFDVTSDLVHTSRTFTSSLVKVFSAV
jgi:hypothetical protein